VVPLAGAGLAFGLADPIGESGFIAAFVGGFIFSVLRRRAGGEVGHLIEELGDVLGGVTFIVFGAVLLGPVLGDVTWSVALYAVLSLTVVRLLPVAIAMVGTGARRPTLGSLGWFGPRGLASIVFAVLVLEEGGLPHDELILVTTLVTIGLSVLAHGLTAAPLADRYADWFETHPRDALPKLEGSEVQDVRWRVGFGHGQALIVMADGSDSDERRRRLAGSERCEWLIAGAHVADRRLSRIGRPGEHGRRREEDRNQQPHEREEVADDGRKDPRACKGDEDVPPGKLEVAEEVQKAAGRPGVHREPGEDEQQVSGVEKDPIPGAQIFAAAHDCAEPDVEHVVGPEP
jgi:Sodium/hydrogen exchanger family